MTPCAAPAAAEINDRLASLVKIEQKHFLDIHPFRKVRQYLHRQGCSSKSTLSLQDILLFHERNFFINPKFIMYYLTFRLPEVQAKLEQAGFKVSVLGDVEFDPTFNYLIPLKYFKMVRAEKIK